MTIARLAYLFYGTVIQPQSLRQLAIAPRTLLGVYHSGKIAFAIPRATTEQFEKTKTDYTIDNIICLSRSQFLLPGLIDTHVHAPQYPIMGNGMDLQLLPWLDTYTFPEEARFKDDAYARRVYQRVVRRTLRNGTTCAAYFGTLHTTGSQRLVDVMRAAGQRGWVGKVCMDQNAPEWYRETTDESVRGTQQLIAYVQQLDQHEREQQQPSSSASSASRCHYHKAELVEPCITPRFAPTCSAEALRRLGELAAEENKLRERAGRPSLPIQTHLSENEAEIAWVAKLFPESASYTDVYDRAGLLSSRTIMAHCVHLTAEERARLKATGTAVAHCAHSNFDLRSGVLHVRQLLDEGLKISLGTDMAGGHAISMLEAMRGALTASRTICIMEAQKQQQQQLNDKVHDDDARSQLSITEVVYMATMGGAAAMGLHDKIGMLLEANYEFDALLVDTAAPDSPFDFFEPEASAEELLADKLYMRRLEKFVMCGDDRNIEGVWVRGRQVAGTPLAN
ncbi:hypothetical protein SYNPS1DRAFT_13797 [Syncephalis pseudoplumigaleata]|uniref:Guanine deaminase n=1 Tax=Syncephalis pseudoplumigaleata TaxID=1712513 RepID=A0A4P9Z4F3_9FUNG|nr:hypothetical protein SYNPS1DRAFT_13797 [Syncephalis pseudoplumigaleata]|eukprot:RKP26721.1 hypothetical protein SYNPS1DRAFT_13797 [Syncephalis pseudoplumigaleata]